MTAANMPLNFPDCSPDCYALVPCAGAGQRACLHESELPKQYRSIHGLPVVAHTLAALQRVKALKSILVVLARDDAEFEVRVPTFTGRIARCGGATRAASVKGGLQALLAQGAQPHDWVLVHDAARCLLRPEWCERLLQACWDDPVGGLLALPLADTLKQASEDDPHRVQATIDRTQKWSAQTPQMFRIGMLIAALEQAEIAPIIAIPITDEASAIEALGLNPQLIQGHAENFKITWPEDFDMAERLLMDKTMNKTVPSFRIGEGWDTHALTPGRPLILGGVNIPHTHGLQGHSDADALLHAITDALLGAAGLRDIGHHFPDTDPQFKGANSLKLLSEAAQRVKNAGWGLGNIDATIIAQAPKMAPHIPAMQLKIAEALGMAVSQINIKAKTAENLGPVGRKESIEARAVCLIFCG
jgi:2-C-methyl-D-erythritol 4-phosphate cytidylyltransferase/2-C-methyl-D-erythritol 2,4-cyclodiphosphate synthase